MKHTSLNDLKSFLEVKISESGVSSTAGDVLAWPNCYPKLVESASFRRFITFFPFSDIFELQLWLSMIFILL